MSNYDEWISQLDRSAYHDGDFTWEEDGLVVYRAHAWSPPGCHDCCGCLFYMTKDGRLDHVEGDPLSPYTNGKLCMRCLDMDEATNHPERIRYPMRRIGPRGSNEWERISWDDALDIIAEKARYFHDVYGPQSIYVCRGTGRNAGVPGAYLSYLAFETPVFNNLFNIAFGCYGPRSHAAGKVLGDMFIADASMAHEDRYANEEWRAPGVIAMWACEPMRSNADGYQGHWLVECVQLGSKVILIDPILTWWGAHAEYWLQLRPGTDGPLAMAMANVIISEELYDREYVEMWCYGFDEFAAACADMTPERASEICGVDAADIRGAARLWATEGPGTIMWGLALEQQDTDPLANDLTIIGLAAICGYVDVPGGILLVRDGYHITHHLSENLLPPGNMDLRPDSGRTVSERAIWGETRQQLWNWEARDVERPRMFFYFTCNTLGNNCADVSRVYDALMLTAEFVVGAEPFPNPTLVALADILLPAGMCIERDMVRGWWTPVRAGAKITSYFEAISDEQIAIDITNRMWPGRFPCNTAHEFMDLRLRDSSSGHDSLIAVVDEIWAEKKKTVVLNTKTISRKNEEYFGKAKSEQGRWPEEYGLFDELKTKIFYKYDPWNATYRKHEKGMLRGDGNVGFATTTGRIELYCLGFAAWQNHPLPHYVEPRESPIATPELYEKYPLIHISGNRTWEFFHSEQKQLPLMRAFHHWPHCRMNAKVAETYGIKDGEWVWIENDIGRFTQKARIVEGVRDDCIVTESGWWYPEDDAALPSLYRTFDSNPNTITSFENVGIHGIGNSYKTGLVKVYPVKPGDVTPTQQVIENGGFPVQKARREAYLAEWKEKGLENN